MKEKVWILLLFLLLPSVLGADISGNIYDSYLESVDNVILTIDTVPVQRVLAVNGTYSLTILPGTYTLVARSSDGSQKAVESIRIEEEGTFMFDLFLFPNLSEEEELLDEVEDVGVETPYVEEQESNNLWFYVILAVVAVGVGYYLLRRKKPTLDAEDPLLTEVLAFIHKEKRTTQKDIRREFAYSEAKISLILTQLESQGVIRKIKKGRGNIIILQEVKQ